MTNLSHPHATRSTLTNRRLNRAIKAQKMGQPNGLRLAARRSALPRARRQDIAIAITGSLLIFLLAVLVAL